MALDNEQMATVKALLSQLTPEQQKEIGLTSQRVNIPDQSISRIVQQQRVASAQIQVRSVGPYFKIFGPMITAFAAVIAILIKLGHSEAAFITLFVGVLVTIVTGGYVQYQVHNPLAPRWAERLRTQIYPDVG